MDAKIIGDIIRLTVADNSINFNMRVRTTFIDGREFTFGTEISCTATLKDLGKNEFTKKRNSLATGDGVTVNAVKTDGVWRVTSIDSQSRQYQPLNDFLIALEFQT